jgi:hypothetical protein
MRVSGGELGLRTQTPIHRFFAPSTLAAQQKQTTNKNPAQKLRTAANLLCQTKPLRPKAGCKNQTSVISEMMPDD